MHSRLVKYHTENAMIAEQAVAGLIQDRKQRGLLEETIVLWAGEMGRTPHTASPEINQTTGRDHHVDGYTISSGLGFGVPEPGASAAVLAVLGVLGLARFGARPR